jgi:hypothetical protein
MSSHSSHTLSSMNHSYRHRHAHDATRCWLLPNTRLCCCCFGASARHHLHRKLSQKLNNGDAVALLLYRRRHSRLRGATAFEHAVGSGPSGGCRCRRRGRGDKAAVTKQEKASAASPSMRQQRCEDKCSHFQIPKPTQLPPQRLQSALLPPPAYSSWRNCAEHDNSRL